MIHSDMVDKSYSFCGYHQVIDMNIPVSKWIIVITYQYDQYVSFVGGTYKTYNNSCTQ